MSFEKIYSKYYDLLYMDKDYEKECEFIEEAFKQYSSIKPVKTILDVGCGTGGHLIPLARRGYEVTGIDKQESMVNIAEEKIHKYKVSARVMVADAVDFNLNEEFDACISMFAVINYIIQTDNLIKAFKNVRRHLKQGALFIFDFWYGPAVLTIKPSSRVKIVEKEGIKVVRTVVPELDTFNCIVKSNYYLIAIKEGKIVDEVREVHVLRYLFPQELIHYLSETGFKVLKFCEFPYLDKPPSENTWNVAVIAATK
ncbi:MAG: methyltransferase domain-containing protein [Candidatus Bathyarchaeia archaeon]